METFYLVISIIALFNVLAASTTPNTDSTTIPPITCDHSLEQCLVTYDEYQCYELRDFVMETRHTRACGDVCRHGLSTYDQDECEKYCNGFVSQNISCDQTTTTPTTMTPETTTPTFTVSQDMLQDDTEPDWKQLSTILGIILGVVGVLFVVSFTLNIILLRRKYVRVPGEDPIPLERR